MMVLELTAGLGLIEAGISVFVDTDSNKQRAAITRQGIMRMLTCYEEILKEKKFFGSPDFSDEFLCVIFRDLCINTYAVRHWR
jgi:hypothetical protein